MKTPSKQPEGLSSIFDQEMNPSPTHFSRLEKNPETSRKATRSKCLQSWNQNGKISSHEKAFKCQNFWMVDTFVEANYLKLTNLMQPHRTSSHFYIPHVYPGWVQGFPWTKARMEGQDGRLVDPWRYDLPLHDLGWTWAKFQLEIVLFVACQFRNF